jgi:hypothetical protein
MNNKRKKKRSWALWCTPENIPASWEAEIRRITAGDWSQQETLSERQTKSKRTRV